MDVPSRVLWLLFAARFWSPQAPEEGVPPGGWTFYPGKLSDLRRVAIPDGVHLDLTRLRVTQYPSELLGKSFSSICISRPLPYGHSWNFAVRRLEITEVGHLPENFLADTGVEDVALSLGRVIPPGFLARCKRLRKLTLRGGFGAVEEVGDMFMCGLSGCLPAVVRFPRLRKAGECFMSDYDAGDRLEFAAPVLASAGQGFMGYLRARDVTLRLPSLEAIPENILRASSATSIQLLELSAALSMNRRAIYCCKDLRALTLEAPELEEAGLMFCYGCTALERADLASLGKIRTIAPSFFSGCTSLTALKLHAEMPDLREVGHFFLYDAPVSFCRPQAATPEMVVSWAKRCALGGAPGAAQAP